MFKLNGTLKVVMDTIQVSDKFSKREFVVTDASTMYPQHVSFQLTQDKCSMLDTLMEGQEVEVSFNLRGREWTSPQGEVKFFNSLEAFRVESNQPMSKPAPKKIVETEVTDDDLPF
jgi:hypothetical protein